MPYIDQNEAGHVVGIYNLQQREGQEFVESAELYVPPQTKDQRIAEKLALRGLTLETEWQLPGIMAGMLAAGAVGGKTEAQVYASNTGYKYAKDLFTEVAAIRAEP